MRKKSCRSLLAPARRPKRRYRRKMVPRPRRWGWVEKEHRRSGRVIPRSRSFSHHRSPGRGEEEAPVLCNKTDHENRSGQRNKNRVSVLLANLADPRHRYTGKRFGPPLLRISSGGPSTTEVSRPTGTEFDYHRRIFILNTITDLLPSGMDRRLIAPAVPTERSTWAAAPCLGRRSTAEHRLKHLRRHRQTFEVHHGATRVHRRGWAEDDPPSCRSPSPGRAQNDRRRSSSYPLLPLRQEARESQSKRVQNVSKSPLEMGRKKQSLGFKLRRQSTMDLSPLSKVEIAT